MIHYKKPSKKQHYKIYDIDSLEWSIEKYQQRVDRLVEAIVVNSVPLTKRDKVKYRCINCQKDVELFSDKMVKRNGEKLCRECAIKIYHKRNPNWLDLTEKQKGEISKRNSGHKIKKYENKLCPYCGKTFSVRLTARNKNKVFCSKNCSIKNWSDYGAKHGGDYGHLGPMAIQSPTKPELYMKKILSENSIEFIYQKSVRINDSMHVFDFWLPEYNTFIEIDGDYWHYNKSNEVIVRREPNKRQLDRMEKDAEKNKYCITNSINLIRIWSSELEEKTIFEIKKLMRGKI